MMEVIRREVSRWEVKSETYNSETEEERKRVDIKYVTKNKTAKKKIGKGRKDSLVVKTITIMKRKSKNISVQKVDTMKCSMT